MSAKAALAITKARPANGPEYAQLRNLVEGVAIAAGLPMPDVYVIDRDADADGVFDEFAQANAVTVSVVSVSYDADLGENVGASSGAFSSSAWPW